MSNESLKISHLVDYSPDNDDPGIQPEVAVRLLGKALLAMATKIDVLTAKLNADAGVTDTDYATNFNSTTAAIAHTES